MANRYTRNLKPDVLSVDPLAEHTDAFFTRVTGTARRLMSESNGWLLYEHDAGDSLNHEYYFGDFKGTISLKRGVDLESVRGAGMVRTPYVLVSLTCQDSRKVNAQVAETQVVQRFEKVFSLIGSAVVGVLGLFVQIAVLRVISFEVTAGCFFVGFFLGGLIGYLLGEPISNYLGRGSRVKTEADHVDLGVARAEWSDFIEAMIEPVEAFSQAVERRPSTATII